MKTAIILLILYFFFIQRNSNKKTKILQNKAKDLFRENPFTVLGIEENASEEQIKSAYREQTKRNHPDLVTHMSGDFQKLAEEKLKKINWAYQEIKKQRGFL